jgi:glycosyltransferase involved in cell wall biosynthesis
MFDQITPLILTYNEAPNIGRTLERLRWARDIVVVDSFSDDETLKIVSRFPQVRMFQRKFDNHGAQWSFGLNETGIATDWVLALDADFVLSPELVDEIGSLKPASGTRGYQAGFTYCVKGRPLRSGLLRAQTVLYRKSFAAYAQDGHTQRLLLQGKVETLRSRILHDDRKPLSRWFASQSRYMSLEAKKLLASEPGSLGRADRIRRWRVIAPLAVLFSCLIARGGVLDGWPGFYYAFQRMLAELLLSLYLIECDLNLRGRRSSASTQTQAHTEQSVTGEQLPVRGEQTDAAG